MNQRKRHFYVLTCLTGAMTFTASLLAWMEPTDSTEPVSEAPETVLGIARSLVTQDVPVHTANWQRVEIVPEPLPQSPDMMLASSPAQYEYHFFIDDRGSLSRANRWRGQLPVYPSPDTVRVRLARPITSDSISAEQKRTLQALLRALDEFVAPSRRTLPVDLDPAFASDDLRAAATFPPSSLLARVSG